MKKRRSQSFVCLFACVFTLALCVGLMGCSGSASSSASSTSQSTRTTFASASNDTPQSSEGAPAESVSASAPAAPSASAELLNEQFSAIANNSYLNVGIAFIDLTNPSDACFVNADASQRSASMIKLLILNEFYEQVEAGNLSRDEGYTLTGADIVGGTGVLQGRGAGASTTYGEMADLMISQSDNVATNVLINRLGMGSINDRAASLGLSGSSLNRMMMDTDAIAQGVENYMSARDAATLLQMIYNGTFVDAASSQLALAALENQADNNGLLAGLPYGVTFAHKTGTLSNAQNDAGIVEGAHPIILSVFCDSDGSFSQGEAFEVMRQCAVCASEIIG